jgi:hypothetical protein
MKERQEQETQRLRRDLDAAQAAARTALTQTEQLRTQLSDLQVRLSYFLGHIQDKVKCQILQ